MAASPSISIAVVGSGGAGALTTGNSLLESGSAAGWYGLFTRTLGSQIRGGEAAALLRLAVAPVECLPDQFDLLIGIDWLNAHRFGAKSRSDHPGDQRPAWGKPSMAPIRRASLKSR
jgi:2-oxoglutarate ferredoxin oxidoreductase subunit alpha